MSDVQMPEPVAWLVEWKNQGETWMQAQANEVTARDQALRQRGQVTDLITTTQAQAYADARVKEALETNFDKAFALLSAWMRSTQAVADMGQVATLSTLVEFALANQGKTYDQLEAEYKLPNQAQQ